MSLVVLGTVALDHVKTPSGSKKDMLGGSAAVAMIATVWLAQRALNIVLLPGLGS